ESSISNYQITQLPNSLLAHTEHSHPGLHRFDCFAAGAHHNCTIAALGFGFVEGLVGDAQHLGRGELISAGGCDAYADCNVRVLLAATHATCGAPLCTADGERGLLNDFPHAVDIHKYLVRWPPGKHDGKFFATVTVGFSAAGDACQPRRHQAQRLISRLMSV